MRRERPVPLNEAVLCLPDAPRVDLIRFVVDRGTWTECRVWARGNPPPLSLHFPTLYSSFSIFYFSFFYFLFVSSIFLLSIPSYSTRILPLHFQAGCRRRRLNLALVLCVLIVCYMYFLVKDVCSSCHI